MNSKHRKCRKHEWTSGGLDKAVSLNCGKPSSFRRINHAIRMAQQTKQVRLSRKPSSRDEAPALAISASEVMNGREIRRVGILHGKRGTKYQLYADGVDVGSVERVITVGRDGLLGKSQSRYTGWRIHGVVRTNREDGAVTFSV